MLILASGSPRRRELLTQAGLEFTVIPANIDETRQPGEAPADYVQRLALEKALAIHALHPGATVLGADTTVVLPDAGVGIVLNKPASPADAERMLRQLANRAHEVHTGIAVVTGGQQLAHVETTRVFFSAGDSLDKAGAYGIQGYAARWIHRIEGDFFNVVGLPVAATVRLLALAEHRS
jgi:septum formation protein